MKKFTLLVILIMASTPAFAARGYQNSSGHAFGGTHNNYHAGGGSYGPSSHVYGPSTDHYGASGNQPGGAPNYGNPAHYDHSLDHMTSRQAMDTSAPY